LLKRRTGPLGAIGGMVLWEWNSLEMTRSPSCTVSRAAKWKSTSSGNWSTDRTG